MIVEKEKRVGPVVPGATAAIRSSEERKVEVCMTCWNKLNMVGQTIWRIF